MAANLVAVAIENVLGAWTEVGTLLALLGKHGGNLF